MNVDALLGIRVEEAILDAQGHPLVGNEAVDAGSGQLHPSIVDYLQVNPVADLHITYERVWGVRHVLRSELFELLAVDEPAPVKEPC